MVILLRHLIQQVQNLFCYNFQIIINFFEVAWRSVFVEVAVEWDFVADFVFFAVHGGFRQMRQYFAPEVLVDIGRERDLLGVFLLLTLIISPVDGHLGVAKLSSVEDFTLFGLGKVAVDIIYLAYVAGSELFVLITEIFAQLMEDVAGVYQLDFALALRRFSVREYPYIGSDAGVVEHVGWQSDDGFEVIVFEHPATNFAWSATGGTSKER
jgi:hypothetical protein